MLNNVCNSSATRRWLLGVTRTTKKRWQEPIHMTVWPCQRWIHSTYSIHLELLACRRWGEHLLTYLLSPLCVYSYIRQTPARNAIVVCLLTASRPGPNSTRGPPSLSLSTDLLHVSFGRPLLLFPAGASACIATLGMDVGGILLTCPIHLHLLFFTSNEMGSIPVRPWSSALDILFGQRYGLSRE